MNKKYLFVIPTLLIIVLIGSYILIRNSHSVETSTNNKPVNHIAPLPKEVTITLNKNGFTPSQVTIKTGTAVRWKNESGSQETVNSDNYPTNQLHRELNFGVFTNDSTVVHTFTKPGTYSYHNQFHHEQEGKVIVVQ
jgi:plastocyanin